MPPQIVIKSAKFGDEFSSTDVSKTIKDNIKPDGSISVDVDSSLIPFLARVTGRGLTELSTAERSEIAEKASNMCGAADQICIEIKTQELAQEKLKEREATTTNSANIVKGQRATIDYTLNGKPMTAIVPAGQKFELGALAGTPAGKPFRLSDVVNPWASLFSSFWVIFGSSILTFLYATSIIITWMTYVKKGSRYLAIGMTIIAIVIPLSGFGLSFFVPMGTEAVKVTSAQYAVAEKAMQ